MNDLFVEGAARFPDAPAVLAAQYAVTYRVFDARVAALARDLRRAGLRPGDRLVLQPDGGIGDLERLAACWRTGASVCLINPRVPQDAAVTMQRIAGVTAVLRDEGPVGRSMGLACRVERVARTRRGMTPEVPDPAAVIFTSGSMGEPKAALLTHANLRHNATAANRNIPIRPGDRWLLSLPLYHVSGLGIVMRCGLGGGAVVVAEPDESIPETIRRLDVTHVSLVPTQLHRLLREESSAHTLRNLKVILLGGAAAPQSLVQRAAALGLPVCTTYGLTEMASQVATTRPGDSPSTWATCGRPLERETVRIAETGEIHVRGPALFAGYLDGDRLDRPMTEDGWFATGDLGSVDDCGRLSVLGRRDSLFRSGGEYVSPEEIERELVRIDGVEEAVVAPVEDAEYGARPVAFVRLLDMDVGHFRRKEQELREALSQRLPGYKIPAAFFPWPEGPASGGPKTNRSALARLAAQEIADRKSVV